MREAGCEYIGKSVKCPQCKEITRIYDTKIFVEALLKKYIIQNKELKELQQKISKEGNADIQIIENNYIEEIDIHNTKVLTQADQYEPIVQWFEKRKIHIQINQEAIDTTGFFDEVALTLGSNFNVLKFVSNQIKYIQNKGYTNVKLELSKKNPDEIKQITSFCKEMHDYAFIAKYYYQKKDKIIRLTLQTAPKIKNFFNGIWMEWFTLMKLLKFFGDKRINPSCMRGLNISFPNSTSNELDIFFLTKDNIPVYIECKSGEFRQDIDKYLKLRNQLNIDKSQFVICVFGLSKEQANGMTSMYDLTFVNETNLIDHIEKII
jgi:phage FluMu protein Com